jgi:hypothetical protein
MTILLISIILCLIAVQMWMVWRKVNEKPKVIMTPPEGKQYFPPKVSKKESWVSHPVGSNKDS